MQKWVAQTTRNGGGVLVGGPHCGVIKTRNKTTNTHAHTHTHRGLNLSLKSEQDHISEIGIMIVSKLQRSETGLPLRLPKTGSPDVSELVGGWFKRSWQEASGSEGPSPRWSRCLLHRVSPACAESSTT